jgi:hypothetical protein
MGLGPKVSNLYKLKILIVNLRIFEFMAMSWGFDGYTLVAVSDWVQL